MWLLGFLEESQAQSNLVCKIFRFQKTEQTCTRAWGTFPVPDSPTRLPLLPGCLGLRKVWKVASIQLASPGCRASQSVERAALDLGEASSSPTLDMERLSDQTTFTARCFSWQTGAPCISLSLRRSCRAKA